MIRKEQLYEQILEQIDLTKETDDEELQELIRTVLDEAADEEYISLSDKIRIGRELFNSFRKLHFHSKRRYSFARNFFIRCVNWMFCRSFLKMIRLQRLW